VFTCYFVIAGSCHSEVERSRSLKTWKVMEFDT